MIADDVVFLIVLVVPLFAARWRVSLFGLALQGALLYRAAAPGAHGVSLGLFAIDCLGVRALLAPLLLWRAHGDADHRHDVIPQNLFAWVAVIGLVLAAFRFAAVMAPGEALEGRIAVATAALVLGMFVLATQESPFSQGVAVLRIENAVTLFELVAPEHADPGVHAAQVLTTAGTGALVAWYLRALRAERR